MLRIRSAPVSALHVTACNNQVAYPVSPVNVYSTVHLACMTVLSDLFFQQELYSLSYACEAPGSLPDEASPFHLWLCCAIVISHSKFGRRE